MLTPKGALLRLSDQRSVRAPSHLRRAFSVPNGEGPVFGGPSGQNGLFPSSQQKCRRVCESYEVERKKPRPSRCFLGVVPSEKGSCCTFWGSPIEAGLPVSKSVDPGKVSTATPGPSTDWGRPN